MSKLILPTCEETIFSLKCLAAGLLAVAIALSIGIPRPFWALTTVYVVSVQTFAGTIRSRGFYRICGTLVSAIAVILCVPLLANYRLLFIMVTTAWVGTCIYASLLDRTPRSYIFRLSAYTVIIIGFPLFRSADVMSATAPFDLALSRVEEIILGICCASVIHSLVFPRSLDKNILDKLDSVIVYARGWIIDILANKPYEKATHRKKLALDITALRILATHLPFDTSNLRWLSRYVNALHDRLALLVMAGADIEEKVNVIRQSYPEIITPAWQKMIKDITLWCQNGPFSKQKMDELHTKVKNLTPVIDSQSSWGNFLLLHSAVQLHRLINVINSCSHLREQITSGLDNTTNLKNKKLSYVSNSNLHTEKRLALRSAMAACISTIAGCLFWMITDWPDGYYIPTYSCLICCIYVMRNDPTPNVKTAFRSLFLSIPISILYLLVIIPETHSFEMLALVLSPFLFFVGFSLIHPIAGVAPTMMLVGVNGMLTLFNYGTPDLTEFFNGQLAQMIGMGLGIMLTVVFRRVDLEKMAYYLIQACWIENSLIGQSSKPPSTIALAVRMTDRIALIMTHLSSITDRRRISSFHIIRDVFVSLNMAALKSIENYLIEKSIPVQSLLRELSHHFHKKLFNTDEDDSKLLQQLDVCLYRLCDLPISSERNRAISILVGIRSDIFPLTPFYEMNSYLSPSYN